MILQKDILSFKIERTEEEITSRSGLAIYAEFLKRFGIENFARRFMSLPGSNRGYEPWRYIEPLMLMLYAGGRHIEDLREIHEDRALRNIIGLKDIPSPSTVGDWLVRMGSGSGLEELKKVDHKVVRKILKKDKEKEYTLFVDATVIEAEKKEAKVTYKGEKGYQPILAGLKEVPVILEHEFREGNEPSGARAVEFLEICFKVLPEAKRIKHLSSDSAFYQAGVVNFCKERGATFTIVADQDKAVKEAIKSIPEKEWIPFRDREGRRTDREIAETIHTMNKTKEAFRLIVLRWRNLQLDLFNPNGYCYHAIATDLECSPTEVVWEYNERANFENYIKELKIGFGMEQMPSGNSGANSFWFCLGVLVYNTTLAQKILLLPEEWLKKTIHSLRWSLIEVGGKVVRHGRNLILKIASTIEKFNLYLQMRSKCKALL